MFTLANGGDERGAKGFPPQPCCGFPRPPRTAISSRGERTMAAVIPERMTVEIEGDFVVFVIGVRINKPWKLHKWLPAFLAMPRMLKELKARPESGFLGSISGGMLIVQYWRSFEHLEAYARSPDHHHWPVWVAFNK